MLVGRESLVRLVGKRKRTLSSSAAVSLLHPDRPTSPPALPEGDAGDDADAESSGRVKCPVCGTAIFGSDYAVNSHLDSCLSRGSKRKVSQPTLLQLNFFSKPSNKSCSKDSKIQCRSVEEHDMDADNEEENPTSFDSEVASDHSCGVNLSVSDSVAYAHATNVNAVIGNADDKVNISSACCLPTINVDNIEKCSAGYSESVKVLETFIVGHRFHENIDLWPGASISIVREPENINDRHAIKVLYAMSGHEQTVGHLPRQLVKYLSPLIDNYGLKVEGFVTSLPKHPRDVFRIDLVCQQMVTYSEMKPGDIQIFESLWENSIRVVGYENFRPNRMKYQQNFLVMIKEVMNQHAQLFTDEEKSFLGSFGSFSDDSQRTFIRLYTRKGPWFRMCNVRYAEVLDSTKAIEELQSAGYVDLFQSTQYPSKIDLREVTDTLTITELREISKLILLKVKASIITKKHEFVDSLCTAYEDGTCPLLPSMISEKAGTCVKISSVADSLLWRIQRLFFLNGEQDLSAFLLVDLGLVKYPTYVCNISQPIFHGRNNFVAYEEVRTNNGPILEENNVETVNRCIELSTGHISSSFEEMSGSSYGYQATFLSCFSASWVYSKVVTLGVSFLECEKRYKDAVKLLKGLLKRCLHDRKRGYWTLRLSVDLEHLGFANESLSVAEEGILDPWVRAGSRLALQKRVLRLGKPPRRWKIPDFAAAIRRKIPEVHVKGRPLNSETGTKNRYYGYDGEQCGVEQLALQYYAGEGGGWRGVHAESGIWLTIFGLLMWDILFADVPDVFRTQFQMAPLDLDSDSFYSSRRDLIESHLQRINDGMADEMLIISWESHLNTVCRGVNWGRHTLSDLRAAVSCIGGRNLAPICRLLARDYKTWSSGMPDLLLKACRGEGPRDQLSEQQRAWMLFLMDSGLDVELCRVTPML
ncbi:unnamed protein product [Spirodela intermedia]|uniref:Fanconi-associated nuclease n=1 Tax=Spirodela intermedia TaxID=51605 RepID=A0A7I8IRL1_SPIIN|nr:unnamed protein product [Spirodela intermedia]CAA6659803.1 unnamed protein product [Spirodela intermedia]